MKGSVGIHSPLSVILRSCLTENCRGFWRNSEGSPFLQDLKMIKTSDSLRKGDLKESFLRKVGEGSESSHMGGT